MNAEKPTMDQLEQDFAPLLDAISSPATRAASEALHNATPEQLGEAAHRGAVADREAREARDAATLVDRIDALFIDHGPAPLTAAGAPLRDRATDLLIESRDELRRLDALINAPHNANFLEGVRVEVAHQIDRWGTAHDRAKAPADWFWLVGYLAGKALAAHAAGDTEKAKHHTISTAAALANWHAAITMADNRMQPGSSDIQAFLEKTFGTGVVSHKDGDGDHAAP